MMGNKSDPMTIAEIPKTRRECVRVRLDEFKGSATVHIWTWYLSGDGRWLAGRHGLAIGLHHLPALTDALQRALTVAMETGRLPPS